MGFEVYVYAYSSSQQYFTLRINDDAIKPDMLIDCIVPFVYMLNGLTLQPTCHDLSTKLIITVPTFSFLTTKEDNNLT